MSTLDDTARFSAAQFSSGSEARNSEVYNQFSFGNLGPQHHSYQQPAFNNQISFGPSTNVRSSINPPTNSPPPIHSKMAVMHRPDVHSGNYNHSISYQQSGTYNPRITNTTLNPIKEESPYRHSNNNFRNTQGYNLSSTQNAQYQEEKNKEEETTCCSCFK